MNIFPYITIIDSSINRENLRKSQNKIFPINGTQLCFSMSPERSIRNNFELFNLNNTLDRRLLYGRNPGRQCRWTVWECGIFKCFSLSRWAFPTFPLFHFPCLGGWKEWNSSWNREDWEQWSRGTGFPLDAKFLDSL